MILKKNNISIIQDSFWMILSHYRRLLIRISTLGDDSFFNSRTLDVYIRKIRGYFSEDKRIEIVTMKGMGYLFLVPDISD